MKTMTLLDLLRGKKMLVETDMKTKVEMVIDHVEQENHSEDLEPATPQNDWWPATRDWTTYTVHFTNGAKKEYYSLDEIKIIE